MTSDIYKLFSPLLAQTLHFAQDAKDVPIEQVGMELARLAERAFAATGTTLHFNEHEEPFPLKLKEKCFFAACAWADEVMLTSDREDTHLWAVHSLQRHFFKTSDAGHLFFVYLAELLDEAGFRPANSADASFEHRLEFGLGEAAASSLDSANGQAILFYAQCILYGFCGEYFERDTVLVPLRKLAFDALTNAIPAASPSLHKEIPENKGKSSTVELAFYVALPLVITFLFGMYNAGILANIPMLSQ